MERGEGTSQCHNVLAILGRIVCSLRKHHKSSGICGAIYVMVFSEKEHYTDLAVLLLRLNCYLLLLISYGMQILVETSTVSLMIV